MPAHIIPNLARAADKHLTGFSNILRKQHYQHVKKVVLSIIEGAGTLADVSRKTGIPSRTLEHFFHESFFSDDLVLSHSAAIILAERKKLNLENKLTDFLSDYPVYGNKVPVSQLLSHTAGIPDHEKRLYKLINQGKNIWRYDRSAKYTEPTIYNVLEVLKRQLTPLFPPESRHKYSDAGYVLLALIIEKVSGLSYREFLKQNIFSPLRMVDSEVLDQTKPRIQNRAIGFKKARLPRPAYGGARNDSNNFRIFGYDPLNYIVGDEGVYSSVNDMSRWSLAWESDVLVSQKTLCEALQPQRLSDNKFGKAGFSWLFGKYKNCKIMYQDGCWVGFRNIMLKIPDKSLTVILLSNRTDLNSEKQRISTTIKLAQQFIKTC